MLLSEHLLLSTPVAPELALTADDMHCFQWIEKELTAFWEMKRGSKVLGRHTTEDKGSRSDSQDRNMNVDTQKQ